MVTIITDSREQSPLQFRLELFDASEVKGMPVGDYWMSIDGNEAPLCFERKSFGDLFGTMTSGYSRFKKEMLRAQELGVTLILLIEGSMREVAKGYKYSKFPGDSMLSKLAMLRVRYDLEYHFFNDRREMARFIEEIFLAVSRNWKKAKKRAARGKTDEKAETAV